MQERFSAQKPLLVDLDIGGVRQKHPYRNLQSLAYCVDDRDCTVSPFGSTEDSQTISAKGMKRIENPDVRGLCTQGIVCGSGIIPMFTTSFLLEASLPMVPDG
jgi:hypothetical protein